MNVLMFLTLGYLGLGIYGYKQMKAGTKSDIVELSMVDASPEVWQYHNGKKLFKWTLIGAAIGFVGFFPLMGMPGALVMELAELIGWSPKESLGDNTWPLAIMMSIILPIIIPVCIFTSQKMMMAGYGSIKSIVVLTMVVSWLLVLMLWYRGQ